MRRLQLDSLRSHVALVSQDTYLFNDTLEANIRLARPDASAQALQLSLEQHGPYAPVACTVRGNRRRRISVRVSRLTPLMPQTLNASSTDGLDNRTPVVVSGVLFVPKGTSPQRGWPLMAWAHGTVGSADSAIRQ
ncbi:MAG: ATP-binding cassette, subfamily bacterial CydCD [Caballeronia sp.]|nr:ATP-binding cassette, subfamily bacterial CydCD [Caballeronia sp.]